MLDCFRRADLFDTSSVEGGTPIGISKLVGSRRCPLTLLTDEGIALIRLELIELSDVVGDLGVVLPPLDANRRHDGDNGLILALSDEFFDGAAGDPASPCEADDHSRYRAHDHSPATWFYPGRDCRQFHERSFLCVWGEGFSPIRSVSESVIIATVNGTSRHYIPLTSDDSALLIAALWQGPKAA